MLHWFRCINCYSYTDATISMVAKDKGSGLPPFSWGKHELRKVASIYGPNASGKSNFCKAIAGMFWNVSRKSGSLKIEPFAFDSKLAKSPSQCAISFSIKNIEQTASDCYIGVYYEYSIQNGKVVSEVLKIGDSSVELYGKENEMYKLIFSRSSEHNITLGKGEFDISIDALMPEWNGLNNKPKSEMLFMQHMFDNMSFDIEAETAVLRRICDWFGFSPEYVDVYSDDEVLENEILKMALIIADEIKAKKLNYAEELLLLLHEFDPFIIGLTVVNDDLLYTVKLSQRDDGNGIQYAKPCTIEKTLTLSDKDKGKNRDLRIIRKKERIPVMKKTSLDDARYPDSIFFDSYGTRQLASIYRFFIDAAKNGGFLVIDEIDTKIHPLILRALIARFRENYNEDSPAQLLFIAHNLVALDKADIHYEEVYFVSKDSDTGRSTLSRLSSESLADNGETYGASYLRGRFGAIPFLNDKDVIKI